MLCMHRFQNAGASRRQRQSNVCFLFFILIFEIAVLDETAGLTVVAFQQLTTCAAPSSKKITPPRTHSSSSKNMRLLESLGTSETTATVTTTTTNTTSTNNNFENSVTTSTITATTIHDLMKEHDPILLFASRFLPSDTAADASALYAWCRRLDEICDAPGADPDETQLQLDRWTWRLDQLWEGKPVDEMDAALTACVFRHNKDVDDNDVLSQQPFRDMISGMRSDAVHGGRRVANMQELEEYAYQVAGTVGLMLLPLLLSLNVDKIKRAKEPAISLGKAIQLINILRDASPDSALGRIYLPQDQLQTYNVREQDILACHCSEGYRRVVQSVATRASQLLEQAEAGRSTLPGPMGPLFVQVIVELYRGYLDELERLGYDNLSGVGGDRVKISTSRKLGASWSAVRKVMLSSL